MLGGEGVSQSPLKDRAFLIFLGQNPPFELRRTGLSSPIFSWNSSWLIRVLAEHLNFRRRWAARLVGVCPPKAKVTRSNRVGCAILSLFAARCACPHQTVTPSRSRQVSNPKRKSAAALRRFCCRSPLRHAANRDSILLTRISAGASHDGPAGCGGMRRCRPGAPFCVLDVGRADSVAGLRVPTR